MKCLHGELGVSGWSQDCDIAVSPGMATTPRGPWFVSALGQLLRETGTPGVVSKEREKSRFSKPLPPGQGLS